MTEETIKLLLIKRDDAENGPSFDSVTHTDDEKFTDSSGLIEDDGDEEGETSKSKMSLIQKLSFLGIAITYITSAMSLSVIGPFFPNEAERKGANPTETGLIFGVFAIVSFLASPVWGKYLPVIGGRFMFLSGSFVTGGCNILFGFMDKIGGKTLFLVYCFIIRTVEAIGSAATLTAGMAICANVYPDNVARMTSFLEIFMGLGVALGPPVGSLFYALGGYELPFIVIGSTGIIVTLANMYVIPNFTSGKENQEAGSLIPVLKIPAVWVTLICNTWCCAALSLEDATLALHLISPPRNVKQYMVGVIFLLFGGVYGIFAPICGYIADIKKSTRFMLAVGVFLNIVSFMLIGPSPLLHLPSYLWITIVSLLLFGFGLALTMVVSFLDMLQSAKCYGLPENLATQSIVSGLYVMSSSLGLFVGPVVGGALITRYGFEWASTWFASGGFLIFILLCLFSSWEFQSGKGRRKPSHVI